MSYCITLRPRQSNPARGFFHIVEQTCYNCANGGTWSQNNNAITLTMGGSGTSGVVRLMSDKGERIAVAVGVDDNKRWCDVVTGLAPNETALVINKQYYNNGGRDHMREKQLREYSVTSTVGTKIGVNYTVAEGKNLQADIIIA